MPKKKNNQNKQAPSFDGSMQVIQGRHYVVTYTNSDQLLKDFPKLQEEIRRRDASPKRHSSSNKSHSSDDENNVSRSVSKSEKSWFDMKPGQQNALWLSLDLKGKQQLLDDQELDAIKIFDAIVGKPPVDEESLWRLALKFPAPSLANNPAEDVMLLYCRKRVPSEWLPQMLTAIHDYEDKDEAFCAVFAPDAPQDIQPLLDHPYCGGCHEWKPSSKLPAHKIVEALAANLDTVASLPRAEIERKLPDLVAALQPRPLTWGDICTDSLVNKDRLEVLLLSKELTIEAVVRRYATILADSPLLKLEKQLCQCGEVVGKPGDKCPCGGKDSKVQGAPIYVEQKNVLVCSKCKKRFNRAREVWEKHFKDKKPPPTLDWLIHRDQEGYKDEYQKPKQK